MYSCRCLRQVVIIDRVCYRSPCFLFDFFYPERKGKSEQFHLVKSYQFGLPILIPKPDGNRQKTPPATPGWEKKRKKATMCKKNSPVTHQLKLFCNQPPPRSSPPDWRIPRPSETLTPPLLEGARSLFRRLLFSFPDFEIEHTNWSDLLLPVSFPAPSSTKEAQARHLW